jgi:hypothetical protein
MNPNASTPFSNQGTIPVPLQNALSSLDVSLENELARYRRLRPRQPRPRPQIDAQRLQPLELFEPGRTPPASPQETIPVAEPVVPPLEIADTSDAPAVSSLVYQPAAPETEIEKPEPPAPQEYLQSSEELLRSLKTESSQEKKTVNPFFTPLGIGSILVLLVSSALLGSAFVDAEGFSRLKLEQFRGETLGSRGSENLDESDPQVAPVNPTQSELPQSPNLASQEFIDLDLGSLSTLPLNEDNPEVVPSPATAQPTQPQAAPTTPEPPASSTAESNLTAALLPPGLRPQPVEPTESNPETTASETTPPEVEAAPAPTNKSLYFVVVDYTGANSFAKAQEIVDEAYLVELPQGVHIQMGAFPQKSMAENFVNELQEKGFVANVYRP